MGSPSLGDAVVAFIAAQNDSHSRVVAIVNRPLDDLMEDIIVLAIDLISSFGLIRWVQKDSSHFPLGESLATVGDAWGDQFAPVATTNSNTSRALLQSLEPL